MLHRAPLEQLRVAQNSKQSLDSQLNHISSGQLRRIEWFRSHLTWCGCHNVRRMQRVLVLTVLASCLCVSLVSASHREANQTTSVVTTRSSTFYKHQRHRWHPHHKPHHHKSHHYYHTSVNRDLQYHIPATSIPNTSSVPLAPFYVLMQQLMRQQQSTRGRQRHPYYEHHRQDSQQDETELNPNHNHTAMSRPWSVRQAGARLLLAIEPQMSPKIIYQLSGINSDDELPVCQAWQVCNKVDTYSSPWIEKQCRCGEQSAPCSQSLSATDGHTIVEKTKQYKLCETVKKLPTCRYFRDITWTITTTSAKSEHDLNSLLTTVSSPQSHSVAAHHSPTSENITRQEVKCVCPVNSVAYILKHQVYKTPEGQLGYRYHFACSPETKMRCKKKEPCRLFTARKRPKVEEVTTNTLCQCPTGSACPANHRHPSVLIGALYSLDNIRTYSAYCYPDGSACKQQDELEAREDLIDQDAVSSTESVVHGNRIAKSATQDHPQQHYFY